MKQNFLQVKFLPYMGRHRLPLDITAVKKDHILIVSAHKVLPIWLDFTHNSEKLIPVVRFVL